MCSTKAYKRIFTDERLIVNTHSIDITAKFAVGIKENQDKHLTLFTKGTELTIFGQLKIAVTFSINLNLKTLRLLICLHMFFLPCILR